MQSGESIYDLIPPPEVTLSRPPMHRSAHPGSVNPLHFGKSQRRANGTFGKAPGDVKPETTRFLKRNTGALNGTTNSGTHVRGIEGVEHRDTTVQSGMREENMAAFHYVPNRVTRIGSNARALHSRQLSRHSRPL